MMSSERGNFGTRLGVILAMALTAKLTRQRIKPFLSAFAPCDAFLAAGFRAAEYYQGMLGAGSYLEPSAFTRFP